MKALLTLLVNLFPTGFRKQFGQDLVQQIQVDYDRALAKGRMRALGFVIVTTLDLVQGSVAERWNPSWVGAERHSISNVGKGGGMGRGSWSFLREGLVSAARTAKRSPGFTAAVIITLGLGIGANATMYGIVDRLLLRPPAHVVDHERVQRVLTEISSYFGTDELIMSPRMSYPAYEELRSHEGLSAVATHNPAYEQTIGSGESATRAQVAQASAEFFPLLGVSPVRGRFYTAEESAPGAALTAVLSEEYWRSVYGADPGVLGRTVEVAGLAHTIIGVAPAGFTGIGLGKADLWLPIEATREASGRGGPERHVVIRLRDGVSIEAAEAEATRLALNAHRELPEERGYDLVRVVLASLITGQGPEVSAEMTEGESLGGPSRVAVWLVGVSVIVLLIACANVANLFMARGTRQRKEVAVRIALGAARGRVVGQMMVESVLLALAGGLLALVLARWGGELVRSTLLPGVYFPDSAVTGRLFVFTALAALVAGVTAGIGPALQGSRADITRGLGEASRGSSARRSKLRGFLTIAQAALSVVLLVGAGLFVRSLGEARSLDLGLDADRLLLARLEFRTRPGREERVALYEEAVQRVSALPGVRSAAATVNEFQDLNIEHEISVPAMDSIPLAPGGGPYLHQVSSGYFETLGVEIMRGRPFESSDFVDGARVVVVSETMARILWPDGDALGACLLRDNLPGQECATVVGIAEDVSRGGFQDVPGLTYYVPQRAYGPYIYVRAEGEAESVFAEVSALLRSYSPEIRYASVRTLDEMLASEARSWTLGATMFTLFGVLALFLAAIGLYSVLAFDVAQRTREIGIRGALGATKSRLLRSVVFRGAGLGILGVLLGLGIAYFAAPYANDLLFEVSPRDPSVFAVVALTLIVVSAGASLIPGLRATHVDPVEALRAE